MTMACPTCNHPAHIPGACRSCNCGESEIVNLHAYRKSTLDGPDSFAPITSSLQLRGYDMGHRVPERRVDN